MVAVPIAKPVSTPDDETAKSMIAGALLTQVPPVAVLESVVDVPTQKPVLPVIGGAMFTVAIIVLEQLPIV